MKKFLFLLCLGPFLLSAENSTIPSKLKVLKHTSWYQDQAAFWKREVDKDPESLQSWNNYYFSLLYANAPDEVKKPVARQILSRWPNSFDANLIGAMEYGFNEEGSSFFRKAKETSPRHPEVLALSVLWSEYEGDVSNKEKNAKLLYQAKSISSSLFNYSYNLLMSVGEDGVLFTEGRNTSVPMMILQDVLKVRTDVTVVDLSLFEEVSYRNRQIANWGMDGGIEETKALHETLKLIAEGNRDIDFYYSLTIGKELLKPLDQWLHLTGLALKYNTSGRGTSHELEENVDKFLKDYLIADFHFEDDYATGRVLEPNYLPSFIILKEVYKASGRTSEINEVEQLICAVSNHAGISEKVQEIIEPVEKVPVEFPKKKLPVKKIEKQVKVVKNNLYAAETEVTNEEYQRFLTYLKEEGFKEEYQIAQIDLSKFEGVALSSMKAYFRPPKTKRKQKKSFQNYPIINISHRAAVLYCEWLTQQYNQQRGRKFKQVKFRLPTLNEWQIAALGDKEFQSWEFNENKVKAHVFDGPNRRNKTTKVFKVSEHDIRYPWYGFDFKFKDQIKNQFDCYLANVLDSECDCPNSNYGDGFTLTAPVSTYFANGMGLFDISGNVAEMVDEKGKAMGGSWAHPPESCTITSISTYEGPDTKVGFRVFMEVIEE